MNTSGALSFDAVIQNTDFLRQINEMERRIIGMSNRAVAETGKIDQAFARLGQLAAGYFTFNALAQLPGQIVKVRGEFQQLEIAFSTMLRSKGKADQLMREIIETAATTPFGLKDVASGVKQLLAYGSSATSVVSEIRMLGDVASGVSAPINDLVYLYGTLRTQGRAYAVDIRQFAGRGIPIYAELAKVLGVGVDKVQELVSAGKVGFPQVEQAFKNMTSGGGMFAGLMDAQSKSLLGLKERLSDAYAVMLNDIGKANQGMLADTITMATGVVENYEPILDVLKVLVATYGAYKAAVIAASVVQAAAAVTPNVIAFFQLAAGIRSATDAQALFNLTTKANPYVLAATLLIGLITAMAVYSKELTAAEQAEQSLTEAREKANQSATAEMAKIELLKTSINNESLSREERNKKLQELIAIAPNHLKALTLDNLKTAEGTAAINGYVDALKRKYEAQELDKAFTESFKREAQAKAGGGELSLTDRFKLAAVRVARAGVTGIPNDASAEYAREAADYINDRNKDAIAAETVIQAKLKERKKLLDEAAQAALKGETDTQKAVVKTVEYYNNAIKKLREDQEQTSTRKEYSNLQTQIDGLEKARNRLTGAQTKAEKAAQKDADRSGPFGSLDYWDEVARKAEEAISNIPSTNVGAIQRQNAIKLDAERKAAAIRKTLENKTFEEELEEKKKQYGLYQQWVEFVNQDSADKQFADLKQGGATYVDYLNAEIAKLELKRADGTITPGGSTNLVSLNAERNEATGKKSAIDVFREGLTKAKDEAKSLTQYLDELKVKQDALDPNDNSADGIEKRRELAEATVQGQRDLKNQLVGFLQSVADSEENRLAITNKYADLRLGLEKKSGTDRGRVYQDSLTAINKAEDDELKESKLRKVEESQEWKDLNKTILTEGRKALDQQIGQQRAKVALLKKEMGEFSDAYREALKKLQELEKQKEGLTLDDFRTFAGLAGQLGDALSEVNGNLGNAGRLLSGIASQANLVTVAFDENASETDKIAAGIQGVIGLVNILTSSANERKRAEVEYYRAMTAQQQQYNLALNNQLGLQSELNESVFVRDFDGRLKDGIAKLDGANKGYQDALDKLEKGQAKTGQRNAVDWSKVGQGAASGAGTGAAIGSIAGPVGAAIGAGIGAVVGGIVGLFGGKKKKDEFGSLLKEYPELIKKGADGWEELDENLAETLISQNLVDENTKLLLENTLEWQKQIEEAKQQVKAVISELSSGLGSSLRDGLVTAFKEGTDAAAAFGNSVEKILEDLLTQMIFSRVMGPALKKLEEEMTASAAGDGNWIDDFGRFFALSKDLSTQYSQGLQDAKDAAKAFGIDILGPSKATDDKSATGLSGAIKGVTEETAGILSGQINAIRISQAETGAVIRQQLMVLSGIERNTGVANNWLESIDRKLDSLEHDPLRGKGIAA